MSGIQQCTMLSHAVSAVTLSFVLTVTASLSGSSDCSKDSSNQPVRYVSTCPNNCSQGPLDGTEGSFNCSIGGIEAVRRFKLNNPGLFSSDKPPVFEPPALLGVGMYTFVLKEHSENSLTITFRLPNAIQKEHGSHLWHEQPKAVLLKFQSVADSAVQDHYFYRCPRERIFEFHDYQTRLGTEVDNPRNITFDCFIGLEVTNDLNVYEISLRAAEGKSISYIVSVPVMYSREETWKPVIATYLNSTNRTLHVIVEPMPGKFWSQYVLQLSSKDSKDPYNVKLELSRKENQTSFTGLQHGQYSLIVEIKECPSTMKCVKMKAYDINASSISEKISGDSRIQYAEENPEISKLVYMVVGSVLGIASVSAVVCFVHFQKRCATKHVEGNVPNGLLIHPFMNDEGISVCYKAVQQLSEFLERYCDCTLVQESVWTAPDFKFGSCSFVLVFDSDSGNVENTVFSHLREEAVKKKTKQNDIRIINVTFSESIQAKVQNSQPKSVVLMKEIDKLYCQIHVMEKLPTKRKHIREYMNTKEGKILQKTLQKIKPEEACEETDNLLPQTEKRKENNLSRNGLKQKYSNNETMGCISDLKPQTQLKPVFQSKETGSLQNLKDKEVVSKNIAAFHNFFNYVDHRENCDNSDKSVEAMVHNTAHFEHSYEETSEKPVLYSELQTHSNHNSEIMFEQRKTDRMKTPSCRHPLSASRKDGTCRKAMYSMYPDTEGNSFDMHSIPHNHCSDRSQNSRLNSCMEFSQPESGSYYQRSPNLHFALNENCRGNLQFHPEQNRWVELKQEASANLHSRNLDHSFRRTQYPPIQCNVRNNDSEFFHGYPMPLPYVYDSAAISDELDAFSLEDTLHLSTYMPERHCNQFAAVRPTDTDMNLQQMHHLDFQPMDPKFVPSHSQNNSVSIKNGEVNISSGYSTKSSSVPSDLDRSALYADAILDDFNKEKFHYPFEIDSDIHWIPPLEHNMVTDLSDSEIQDEMSKINQNSSV